MGQRVLIFAAYFLPFSGGYANSIFQLAIRLSARGHKVTVVTANTENAKIEEIISGVQIYRLPCWNILGGTYPIPKPTATLWKVVRRLRADKYTIISTQTRFFITSFLGAIFARVYKIPYVHTERGSRHSIVKNKIIYGISLFVDHILGRWVVRGAQCVVGVSAAAKSFAIHLGAKEALVIPNGVNEEFIHPLETRRTPLIDGSIKLLYVGRLIYAKGIQDLLNAVASLRQAGKDISLTIIGNGPYLQNLQTLVSQLKLDKHIIFTGEQTREQILQTITQHDIFVNPSYSEGLPTSVLEAAAAGIAVIATDVGGTKEIVPSEQFGLLYTAGDVKELEKSIVRYCSNPELRKQAVMALAERTALEFSWTSVVLKYEAEFLRLAPHL
jgi:glycosyltransferase involved in cell wall biosynthesis